MVQRRDHARFALEALAELGLGNLDRDDTIKTRVARLINFTHAPCADGREDFVGSEAVTYREGHMSASAKFTRSRSGLRLRRAMRRSSRRSLSSGRCRTDPMA